MPPRASSSKPRGKSTSVAGKKAAAAVAPSTIEAEGTTITPATTILSASSPPRPAKSSTTSKKKAVVPDQTDLSQSAGADVSSFFGAAVLPRPYIAETDFADWIYRPHTITTAIVGFMALFGLVFYQGVVQYSPVKAGLLASFWAFLLFGMIYLPDGAIVRPHPVVWRGVLAVAVAYMMLMIFFFTLPLATTKEIIGLYDPSILLDQGEQSYAEDCRISTPEDPFKFFKTVGDIFLLAHGLGYTVKMIVIRDWRIVTFISLIFEVVEVSGQHVLENFKECWWDHALVDVLICNALGTYCGHLALKYFQAKEYHWSRLSDIKGFKGKTQRLVTQFLPRESPVNYRWRIFDRPKNLSIGVLLITVILIEEVNCFTMKSILNLSPKHHLVVFRICMYGFVALPGLRQFNDFAYDPKVKRLGAMAWVGASMLFFETAWICKMIVEGNYFRTPWPPHIVLPWFYNAACSIIWITLHFGVPNKSVNLKVFLRVLFYSMPLAFLALGLMGNVDTGFGRVAFDNWSDRWGLWPKIQ